MTKYNLVLFQADVASYLASKPPKKQGKKPEYVCPECGAIIQDFRRHFERHYKRGSKEVR